MSPLQGPLASAITYKSFGPMKTLTYGNGLTGIVTSNNVQSLVYGPDANANVTTITDSLDSTKSKGYGYDSRDQLTSATCPWGSLSWGYDNVGNRLNEGGTSYTTTPGSNRLSSVAGTSYFYDNNGNTIAAGSRTYVYNQNQRLVQVTDGATSATYAYNGLGQRVKKVVNGVTTLYHYDLDGRLIAETDASGMTQVEYVYLNGQPLAMIRAGSIYYFHNDHLGTPQKLTNSTKAVVWNGEFKPFGQAQSVTGSVVNNLRFAGQYFDAETGLHYNYFRDYNPLVGRYVQADPIGLRGGVNLYAYVQNNPINRIDPLGLRPLTDSEKDYLTPYIPQRDLNNADVHVGEMPWYAPSWAAGITRGNDIYINDPNQTFNTPGDMGLLGHELVHVGQYVDGMTWLSYLWSTRNGYNNSHYEVDAYKIGAKIEFELNQKYGEQLPCSSK